MGSNKDRLYIALYVRAGEAKMPGKEDTYHWALVVGPKEVGDTSRGIRFHTTDTSASEGRKLWVFEERESTMRATGQILVRVVIAKITDRDRVLEILRTVPVVQNDPSWNSVLSAREALNALKKDSKAVGTSNLDWQTVRDAAMAYCQRKRDAHRFDGKGKFNMRKAATYDFLEKKEIIP